MSYKFIGNVIISGIIECMTGLHIGATDEAYQIGGMDNPVIKDPLTGYPYIPGSSLKGKLRTIMEWTKDKIDMSKPGGIHECQERNCPVCRIFGTGADNSDKRKTGPTRILVRDSFPTEKTIKKFDILKEQKGVAAEIKTEVNINRITSKPISGPRSLERIPKGAEFNFEMIYSVYDIDDKGSVDVENLKDLITVLKLMEESALGGGGSRGAGRIKFKLHKEIEIKKVADYEKPSVRGEKTEPDDLQSIKSEDIVKTIKAKLNIN